MCRKLWLLASMILMAAVSSVRGQDTLDEQLLHAAYDGDFAEVKSLLGTGADINAASKGGPTPLWYATMQQHEDIALFLIDHGAAVNRSWFDHGTALMWAATWDERTVIRELLRHGARTDQRDDWGWTAHKFAVFHAHPEAAAMLAVRRGRRH